MAATVLLTDSIDPAQGHARGALVVERDHKRCLLVADLANTTVRQWAFLHDPQAASNPVLATQDEIDCLVEGTQAADRSWGANEQDDLSNSAAVQEQELTRAGLGHEASPAVRLLGSIVFDALADGASDIHLEAIEVGMAVKCRLDGVLSETGTCRSKSLAQQVVSRIKVLSELDIAERRVPQDGRFRIRFESRAVDIRVSVIPSVHGEDVVLRILDRHHLAKSMDGLTLAKLGFAESIAESFKALCRLPHGLVLVTGPTGSGKTTTLYATLTETRDSTQKIITIEDPVEYQLDGILQIPVNDKKNLTFARGLRSVLRHDPDRILVGEIRDAETAAIAIQSALTGHLVYATVHANSAVDVLGRFAQLGIDLFSLSAAMNGVLAQRLIRVLCPDCSQPKSADESVSVDPIPVGCDACRHTGYRGRRAIGEMLTMTPELRALIAQGVSSDELAQQAHRGGMVALHDQALALMRSGLTSQEEVARVSAA